MEKKLLIDGVSGQATPGKLTVRVYSNNIIFFTAIIVSKFSFSSVFLFLALHCFSGHHGSLWCW